jgi:REP element-mobilizing transposase RayT
MSRKTTESRFITFTTHLRWQLPDAARDLALEACVHAHNRKRIPHAAVIMPDHVHLILTPSADKDGAFCIPQIIHAIKSEFAHRINKALGGKAGYGRVNRLIMYFAAMKASLAK